MSAFVFVRSNKHLLLQSYSNKFSYDSSLPEGAFGIKNILQYSYCSFFLIGNAFTEPHHYGGVFVIQKTALE